MVFGRTVSVLGVILFCFFVSLAGEYPKRHAVIKMQGNRLKPVCVIQYFYAILLSGSPLHKVQITLATQFPFVCTCISISCISSEVLLRVI